MKPIIVHNNLFLSKWAGGVCIFPFIILREEYKDSTKYDIRKLVNHETIHFHQCLETLLIGFYVIYLIEFLVKSLIHRSFRKGYKAISFEIEAYNNEKDYKYIDKRKRFSWVENIF